MEYAAVAWDPHTQHQQSRAHPEVVSILSQTHTTVDPESHHSYSGYHS